MTLHMVLSSFTNQFKDNTVITPLLTTNIVFYVCVDMMGLCQWNKLWPAADTWISLHNCIYLLLYTILKNMWQK